MTFYTERIKCIFCKSSNLQNLLLNDLEAPLSWSLKEKEIDNNIGFMPFNIQNCKNCNNCQIKYIGDLDIIYGSNHVDNYGIIKNEKFNLFAKFIIDNSEKINNIIEIGTCYTDLANNILNKKDMDYTIIEPSLINENKNQKIKYIKNYIENVDLLEIKANTLIMSDVYEHFYNPVEIIEKIQNSNIEYIYMNHPHFDYMIKNNVLLILNTEHTFIIEHQYLFSLFENFGFELSNLKNYNNHSLFLEFKRTKIYNNLLYNINTLNYTKKFINEIEIKIKEVNDYMKNNREYYIWPCSIHSITLFQYGMNYKKLSGILDNSSNKIGKKLNCYNLSCYSFDEIINKEDNNICIFIGGNGKKIMDYLLNNKKIEILFNHRIQEAIGDELLKKIDTFKDLNYKGIFSTSTKTVKIVLMVMIVTMFMTLTKLIQTLFLYES